MSQKKSTLIGGVAVLSIAGMLTKIIGMFFRVPLGNMIGSAGMGIYQAVYPTYTMLVTISIAGIPVAISRLVSESVTLGRYRQARALLRTALALLAVLGTVLMVLLILFARPLAIRTGDPETTLGFIAIAPSILLVSLMSALRGYMQGRRRMTPTAVSQVIEQLGKVIVSFPLAALGMQRFGVAYAAAGALLGITVGEAAALVYMTIIYRKSRPAYLAEEAQDRRRPPKNTVLARRLIGIAFPIILGAMIVPLSQWIDSAMIRVRLQEAAGFSQEAARSLYGLLSGYAISLVNVPTALAMAVCAGMVPAISSARIERRYRLMRETSSLGLRLSALIGYPCSVGMSLLSTEIIALLFPRLPAQEIAIAGHILSLSAWTIWLFTHVQASTGILQGAGMHRVPVYSLAIGVFVKIALNYTLIGIPAVNIYGAPLASIACYAISMVMNLIVVVRKTRMRFDWGGIVLRPGLSAALMGVAVLGVKQVLDMSRRTSTVIAVLVGVLVYLICVLLTGALRREDTRQMPGGPRLERLLVKAHIWRSR